MTRFVLTLPLLALSATLTAQQASTTVYRNEPAREPFSDALLSRLQLPAGYRISVFARDLVDPRMMKVGSDGTVYVTRWKSNDVLALRDTNGDGVADERLTVGRLDKVHGIELREPFLAVATPTEVWVGLVDRGRVVGGPRRIIADLPDGGQHENRVVRLGPDGLLYVSVGSSCNDCVESNQRDRGTIIRYSPAGQRVDVLAKGLRNTVGYDWHPDTGQLWGMDHGNDFHGDDLPPEELNRLTAGRHYGWPNCYGMQQVDPMTNDPPSQQALLPGDVRPIGPITPEAFCALTAPATQTYTAHAAPMSLLFYRASQFPGARGDAFVTLRGSWNRGTPVGYKVVRVRFASGEPTAFEDFLTGFLSADGQSSFGRPVDLAATPDGSLLLSDDGNGVIYRISYVGQ